MKFSDNELYKEVFHSKVHDVRFYMPVSIATGYHQSRFVAASSQDIYSASGITKKLQAHLYQEMKRICQESMNKKTYQGYMDINTLLDNLIYRHRYPVDEHCAIRMGAIFTLIEGENPDEMNDIFTQKKVNMAIGDFDNGIMSDGDLYAFFLTLGGEFTPSYRELSNSLTDTQYHKNRSETLRGLTPQPSRTE